MFNQEVVCVPGRLNQAALAASKIPPRPVMRALGGLFQKWSNQGQRRCSAIAAHHGPEIVDQKQE